MTTTPRPYLPNVPSGNPSSDELRERIPGWGADLEHANRPAYPREVRIDAGAHWDLPDQQPELAPREKSMEHARLTPVFGTVAPLKGASGVIRRFAYDRFSEGRAAHWLLLILGDRVDAMESHLVSLASLRPDNPITETGILAEPSSRPISSRFGRKRADLKHQWMDPILVAGPWLVAGAVAVVGVRAAVKALR